MNWLFTSSNLEETGNEPVFDPDAPQLLEEEKKEDIDQEEEKKEDIDQEEESEEEEEEESEGDSNLQLELNNATDQIARLKKRLHKIKMRRNDYKKKCNKLERDLEDSEYLIETNDGRIRYKAFGEIKDLTVYDDQRPIDKKHVENIKKHQLEYFDKYGELHDSLPLIVATQPDGIRSFINKRNQRTSEILIDGQHRLAALNKIFTDTSNNYRKISKIKLTVKFIECQDMDQVHEEFISINKGIPLTKSDLDKNKRIYCISEQVLNFIERLEGHDLFSDCCNTARNIRRQYRKNIYTKVLKDRISENEEFSNLMRTQHIQASELMCDFVSFNKNIFVQCSEIDFDTFRKEIGFKKKILTKRMEFLKRKLSLYKSNHDTGYIKNIISYVYFKNYENLVIDFMNFIKQEKGFDNLDGEDEDEDSDSE